jgi:hypothetical protein
VLAARVWSREKKEEEIATELERKRERKSGSIERRDFIIDQPVLGEGGKAVVRAPIRRML